MAQLWGGRFTKETDQLVYNFNASITFDKRFYKQDIRGSLAHVAMLAKQGILTEEEKEQITDGLNGILKDVESGKLEISDKYEDIHSFVEATLIDRIGDPGKKLHTGRSRNDQVALDMKLFTRDEIQEIDAQVKELLDKERYVIAAEYEEDTGKYASLTDEKLEELRELCDVMLVEADGAKHHPVKVPEKWEPVIPRCADIVISVIGLDCLGQPISQSAYRMERTSEFLRKSLEAPITEEDIVKIATSICGLFKDVEERVYRVYLNKSDILKEKEPAEHIVEELERKNTVAAYGSLLEE